MSHLDKVHIINGDATKTIPRFLKDDPQVIVALLHINFDIHKPTKIALKNFIPRMSK